DEATINQLQAGEVVERPASVVKELIVNSVDAKSKKIIVEIEDGGKKLIRITDNGNGIESSEVEKSFLIHATSKINKIDDLYDLYSLGFRGEALASIASV
ncbi:ATP-binding protein, partial [Paeniclostridium sordellii]|uniref:ATP-binding protein n=1 Tax=Paraclostridium sordellii TaxID=1505 RepID=UPI00210BFFF7